MDNSGRRFREKGKTPTAGLWRRGAAWAVIAWMATVMLLSYVVFDGPGVSSLVKRSEWLHRVQQTVSAFFGEGAR